MIGDLLAKMEAVYPSGEKAFLGPRNQNHSAPWVESVHVQGLSDIQLHHYYRALDFLCENKEAIEEQLYGQMTTLLNFELDFVFYDKTSSYFEGDCTDVEMASHGYSKDHRGDRKQVVIGLMMTREGMPVAHQVFPGNMHNTKTFHQIVEDLKKFPHTKSYFCW